MSTPLTSTTAAPTYSPARATHEPILVATDGGDGTHAIAVAAALAARSGTEVRVVSVLEPVPASMAGIDGTTAWPIVTGEDVAPQRERIVHQLRAAGGDAATWPVDVIVDTPAHAIAATARERHASVVVMGTGRHDLAAHLSGGEVALRTVRRATVPVLAIGPQPMRVPPRVAVAAVDFSPSSVHAARAALDLLADGGTLHLVHVWSRNALDLPRFRSAEEAYERALPQRFARVEAALLDRPRAVTILPASLVGHPAEQVVDFARSHGADLIAAGRQGHGLLERLLVGRVTSALLRGAPCAVLVTPAPAVGERTALELALTGTAASHRRDEWPALLDTFTRRNRGRRTTIEVDDPELGAQALETGYTLRGATYDPRDGRVELMLGAPDDGRAAVAHLTHVVDGVTSIAVHGEGGGPDVALSVRCGTAQTLLTILPESAPRVTSTSREHDDATGIS